MDVELDGVRVERDGRSILNVPSLRIRHARTTAVLGPNGSGKTTLLRLIAGLERPRSGEVRVGGARLAPRARADVAFVFQEQVFLRQSVRANLELGLRLRGVDAAERRARIADAAALMGIGHLLDRQADRLSGGEGRRVSLARALCLRAPLVLLDEPLEGLDERTYSRLLDELPQVLAAFDATTLLVTHSRHEALRLAEDLVVLVDGRVEAAGDKHDVAATPRTAAVADVLGYTVLVKAGRHVAVPPGALRPGAGEVEFDLVVDDVLDVVERRDVIGRIDDVRVHVVLGPADGTPRRGDRLPVHAERHCVLSMDEDHRPT
jgi:ABC-type sugar transport system ATPase subunit